MTFSNYRFELWFYLAVETKNEIMLQKETFIPIAET